MEFFDPQDYQPTAAKVFEDLRAILKPKFKRARIEHIGSSSVPGLISKGDLDIFLGVEPEEFGPSIVQLKNLGFKIKVDSFRNQEHCPFTWGGGPIPTTIQMAINGSEFEFFLTFRDFLRKNRSWVERYNDLKIQSVNLDEESYRKRKENFIHTILDLIEQS